MKTFFIYALTLIFAFQFVHAQEINTGLIFTSQEDYERIGVAALPFGAGEVPTRKDLSVNMPPAGDQNPQNACVAFATTYACLSYYHLRKQGYNSNQADHNNTLSPAYVYNQINDGQNKGTYFEDAFNILSSEGACTYATMPFQPNDLRTQPNQQQKTEAANFRIDTYRRLNLREAVVSIKAELMNENPVIIATSYDESYYGNGFNKSSSGPYIWNRVTGSNIQMGHAILIVGFDDELNAFKFLNSWGRNWGNNGYGWISYDIADRVIREAYTIKPKLKDNPDRTEPTPDYLTNTDNEITSEDVNNYGLDFHILNVMHENTFNNPRLDPRTAKMTIQGNVSLPPDIGQTATVVVNIYFADPSGRKGYPVSSFNYRYALPNGQVATGTPPLRLQPGRQIYETWNLFLPYSVLKVRRGQVMNTRFGRRYQPVRTNLLAEPVLFIDGYPIRVGQLIPFFVDI